MFHISCLCYYNRLTPNGAELTKREANSIHTDPNNLPTLSFVIPLGDWDGGATVYSDYHFKTCVSQGDVYALEATNTRHMVEPVTNGKRVSLVFFTKQRDLLAALGGPFPP